MNFAKRREPIFPHTESQQPRSIYSNLLCERSSLWTVLLNRINRCIVVYLFTLKFATYTAFPLGFASFADNLLFPLSHFQGSSFKLIYYRLIDYFYFDVHEMSLLEWLFTQSL